MKRIILHWTAGGYFPNATDLKHYHKIVDRNGEVYNGNFSIKDNEECKDGKYAQHTGQGNTNSIGVSMCGMAGFKNRTCTGNYPLTKMQCESCFKLCAELAKEYNIPLDKEHIFTHYTYNQAHKITTGKVDIIFLPPFPTIKQEEVIDFIISKIKWYYDKL